MSFCRVVGLKNMEEFLQLVEQAPFFGGNIQRSVLRGQQYPFPVPLPESIDAVHPIEYAIEDELAGEELYRLITPQLKKDRHNNYALSLMILVLLRPQAVGGFPESSIWRRACDSLGGTFKHGRLLHKKTVKGVSEELGSIVGEMGEVGGTRDHGG